MGCRGQPPVPGHPRFSNQKKWLPFQADAAASRSPSPVQIGQLHVVGVGHGAGDDQTLPQEGRPSGSRHCETRAGCHGGSWTATHVEMSVAVHVTDGVALEAFGIVSTDEMSPKVPGPVVFQPVEGIVPEGVGTGQVQVAVAVQVRSRHAEGIGVIVENQVLGESGRLPRQGSAVPPAWPG